jgi:hypothetical protein
MASPQLSPTSAPIFQDYPAHGVTPGRFSSINHIKETRTTVTASPTPPFFNQGHEKPKPFLSDCRDKIKSNPHALTCRLDDGVLSLSTKERQNKKEKKENACTGIAFDPCR